MIDPEGQNRSRKEVPNFRNSKLIMALQELTNLLIYFNNENNTPFQFNSIFFILIKDYSEFIFLNLRHIIFI